MRYVTLSVILSLSKDEARHPSVILSLSKDEARHPELVEGLPVRRRRIEGLPAEGGLKHVTLSLSKGLSIKESKKNKLKNKT